MLSPSAPTDCSLIHHITGVAGCACTQRVLAVETVKSVVKGRARVFALCVGCGIRR